MLAKHFLRIAGTIPVLAIAALVVLLLAREFTGEYAQRRLRDRLAAATTREVLEIRAGKRTDVMIYAPFCLESIVSQTDCTAR